MRINSISFENYRCFLTGKIDFPKDDTKNMVILIGPNGGGKTETLFAFWWILYDFDFSKLINKENTPYALNSGLYRELEQSQVDTTKRCSATLEFEDNGITYVVQKWCEYKKTNKSISKEEYRELSYYQKNGELTLPIRDAEQIRKQLTRIIPKTILYGIVFDGERMQKLNTADESSLTAIKGVLSDITNVELLEKCDLYFENIKKELNKNLKQYKSKVGNRPLDDTIDEIEKYEKNIADYKINLNKDEEENEKNTNRLNQISSLLEKNLEVKNIEIKRKEKRENLVKAEKRLDNYYKNFSATLRDGYFMATEKLLKDVEEVIKKYDVPEELTVPAVKDIIRRQKCICGREMNSEAIITLNKLIEILPPDNINSTISEMIRQFRQRISDEKDSAKNDYKLIADCEKEIIELKRDIAELSTQIISLDDDGSVVKDAIDLEKENIERLLLQGALDASITKLKEKIMNSEEELKKLKGIRDSSINSETEIGKINQQVSYIEKCKLALDRIKEINKDTALSEINNRIAIAYEKISEDSSRGRKIRIIQYDLKRKYQIVVYMEDEFNKLINKWNSDGTFQEKLELGLSKEEIEEEVIIKCIDANSTGQSKINTFAFVKAILDYSNAPKKEDSIEIRKDYPLLIDAPFGDISDENLSKSSNELHSFANQVILMIDKDKYKALHTAFDCYTIRKYAFQKATNSNYSTIKLLEE